MNSQTSYEAVTPYSFRLGAPPPLLTVPRRLAAGGTPSAVAGEPFSTPGWFLLARTAVNAQQHTPLSRVPERCAC